jgi:hypothetical protein
MRWKCPRCGIVNDDGESNCCVCAWVQFGHLILLSTKSGRELRLDLDTPVGRSLLGRIIGEDVRFASEPQFHLRRSEVEAAWLLIPDPKAVNPTCVGGTRAGSAGKKLVDGDEITIGKDKARLKVRIEL